MIVLQKWKTLLKYIVLGCLEILFVKDHTDSQFNSKYIYDILSVNNTHISAVLSFVAPSQFEIKDTI